MRKKSSERGAGSDGNYMTKQNLWLLHRMTELLYKGIPDGVLLPDWAESKINSAADHIKAVAGWAMHESHGDDLHPPPEANPIHLAGEGELRSKLVRLAHTNPSLRPHLLPLVTKTAAYPKYEAAKKSLSEAVTSLTAAHAKLNNALTEMDQAIRQEDDLDPRVEGVASKIDAIRGALHPFVAGNRKDMVMDALLALDSLARTGYVDSD